MISCYSHTLLRTRYEGRMIVCLAEAAGWMLLVFGFSVGDSLVRIDCERGSSGSSLQCTMVSSVIATELGVQCSQ